MGTGRLAWATHGEPGRGKAVRISMVTSYEPCTNPNTTTGGGLPTPSCSPPVPSDPVCGLGALFGIVGMAKGKAQVHDGDIQLTAERHRLGSRNRLRGSQAVRRRQGPRDHPPLHDVAVHDHRPRADEPLRYGLLHRHERQLQAEDEHHHRGLRCTPSRPARGDRAARMRATTARRPDASHRPDLRLRYAGALS